MFPSRAEGRLGFGAGCAGTLAPKPGVVGRSIGSSGSWGCVLGKI